MSDLSPLRAPKRTWARNVLAGAATRTVSIAWLLAFRDLEEAVALDTYVRWRIGVKRGASDRHQNPILGFYMRR